MKKLCVFCVLCLVCLCELRAGDTVRVSIWDRLWEHRSVVASFVELSYRNPAVRYDRYSSSLTRATVGGQYTSESEPVLLQSGDGEKSIGFQADSYIRKKNYCLWGNALYRSGTRPPIGSCCIPICWPIRWAETCRKRFIALQGDMPLVMNR